MLGFHFQKPVNNWTEILPGDWSPTIKAIDRGDILRTAKEINPRAYTILRHHYDDHQIFGGTYADNQERARAFFRTFIDKTFRDNYAAYTNAIEEWNEYIATSQSALETDDRLRWAEAAAQVWRDEYRSQADFAHIRLILCNTACGNLIDYRFAQIAIRYGAILGYHPYILVQHRERWEGDWMNISGLFATMETAIWPDGPRPDWCFTEGGPFEACETGWRHSACLGGDRDLYIAIMRGWIREVKNTAAYSAGRIRGCALFNSGDPSGRWRYFENTAAELLPLAAMIREEIPPQPPVPPPTPDPEQVQVKRGIYLNARTGPTTAAPAIGYLLPQRGPIEVLERSGPWIRSDIWFHGDYTEPA